MFEKASRLKLTFNSVQGRLNVEDLWDIPLTGKTSLDAVAVSLYNELQESNKGATSFVVPKAKLDGGLLQLKFDIAKHILDVRVKERNDAKLEKDRSEQKQKLLGILARKQDAELEGKTAEELNAMIQAL